MYVYIGESNYLYAEFVVNVTLSTNVKNCPSLYNIVFSICMFHIDFVSCNCFRLIRPEMFFFQFVQMIPIFWGV